MSSPVQTVSGGNTWRQISVGNAFMAAIKTDGTLWTWGSGSYGVLGNNSAISRSSPIQTISAGTNWSQVAAGYNHMAAVKTDGTLWLWGRNNYGQLGDSTFNDRSSPIQTVAGDTTWRVVSAGNNGITGAIKTDGTLWTWGRNSYGALGDNTTTTRTSPVQTSRGGTDWKRIAVSIQDSSTGLRMNAIVA
jgi:alpha-tubulin suppressor-like RCC1 family protein